MTERGEIVWLRHCQSVANAGGPAEVDTPLSAEGAAAAARLEGAFDVAYTSPLRRARDTLALSRIAAGRVVVEPLLREVMEDASDTLWDGEPLEDAAAASARLARLRDWLRGVAAGGGRALVVSHADLFWRLSSHVRDGVRYGTHLANGERARVNPRWLRARRTSLASRPSADGTAGLSEAAGSTDDPSGTTG